MKRRKSNVKIPIGITRKINIKVVQREVNFMNKIPDNINKIIYNFIDGVNEILGQRVKRIILYGSYARRRF